MKAEYVNFALWVLFLFFFFLPCLFNCCLWDREQARYLRGCICIPLYAHVSGSRETCLPPVDVTDLYILYILYIYYLSAPPSLTLLVSLQSKVLRSCKNARLIWLHWTCVRWWCLSWRDLPPSSLASSDDEPEVHPPRCSHQKRWRVRGRQLYAAGEAVSRLRLLENWVLQLLPFEWDFHVNIKVFAHGLLVFLGPWPESLGSAVQLCRPCPSGTKVNSCLLLTYRRCFIGLSMLEIRVLSVRVARSVSVAFCANLFIS